MRIPIGIEKVLCRAAAEPEFEKALLDDRAKALESLKSHLSGTEAAILSSIPAATLAEMIRRIDLERHSRRRFMRSVVAATLAAATAGWGALGCEGETDSEEINRYGGMAPDPPEDLVEQEDAADATEEEVTEQQDTYVEPEDVAMRAGIPPDESDIIEYQDHMAAGGILPDTD